MSVTKTYASPRNVKQLITTALTLGLLTGFIFGVWKSFVFIQANRYFELGMYNIAFSHLQPMVNHFTLAFTLVSVFIFLIGGLVYIAAHALKTRTSRHTYYAVTTILLLGAWLCTGYYFKTSPWYPASLSLSGIAVNDLLAYAFALLAGMLLRATPAIGTFVPRLMRKILAPRYALIALGLILVLNGYYYFQQLQTDRSGMNVLFITIDTLRADHLGCYGYKRDTSPNIDNLAKEGVVFSQGIVQWPKTLPSFASMLTGTYAHTNGITQSLGQAISSHFVLLAELLKNAGYSTAGFVTNPNLAVENNFNQGFDTYLQGWRMLGSNLAESVTDKGLSWLKSNKYKKPFFLWLHYLDPHSPYTPPKRYQQIYVNDKFYDGSQRVNVNHQNNYAMGRIPACSRLWRLNPSEAQINKSRWQLKVRQGSSAKLEFPPDHPEVVHIDIEKAESKANWDIQLNQRGLVIKANHTYITTFRARADRPRPLIVGLAKMTKPWNNLGLYKEFFLTTEWQSFKAEFLSIADEDTAGLHFNLADSNTSVDLAAVELIQVSGEDSGLVVTPFVQVPHDVVGYYIAQYDAEIRYMDEQIGRVLNELKAMGLEDNSLVILTADHGDGLGDHNYYFEHGRLPYDACSRVPLIIKIPGRNSVVKIIDKPVELIDVMPTILDVLQLSDDPEAQGKTLVPLMLGREDNTKKYAFTEAGYADDYQRVIRNDQWKLIYIPDEDDQSIMHGMPFELYNIKRDPHELNNLIEVETEVAAELKAKLLTWMASAKRIDTPDAEQDVTITEDNKKALRSLGYIK